jgi:sucrose-6-phosphate hydrolase SacC (GH32 family)
VNWTELPDAITETYQGEAWNGSSVVDVNNTAGFGAGAIVTLYTSAAGSNGNPRMSTPNYFAQSLAYSTDNGRTFKYYQGNPVVPNIAGYNHDPVVFWYAPTSVWVMVVYVDNDGYHILNSPDLKNWVYKSKVNITGTSEVPDLFPLPLDGNTSNMKWVFSADYRQYIVGTFDGSTFTQQYGPFWYGWQRYDLSAALTFNGDPKGRRIMLSNGRTDYPGMPFNRYMNLPSELTLKTDAGVPKLYINPVAELSALRTSTQTWGPQTLNPGVNLMSGITGEAVELEIVFNSASARSLVEFSVGEFVLSYNFGQGGKVGAGGQWRSLTPEADGNVHIRAYYDRGVWELFCNDGQFYYPAVLTPKAGTCPISLVTKNDSINIVSAKLHQLGSFQGGTSR